MVLFKWLWFIKWWYLQRTFVQGHCTLWHWNRHSKTWDHTDFHIKSRVSFQIFAVRIMWLWYMLDTLCVLNYIWSTTVYVNQIQVMQKQCKWKKKIEWNNIKGPDKCTFWEWFGANFCTYAIQTYALIIVTVKILKFGTPQTIAIIVLKIEKFDVTLH